MVLFIHKRDWVHPIGVVLLVLLSAVSVDAAEERTANPPKTLATATPTTPAAPAAIPPEEVAKQAMQVDNLIRGFATNLADTEGVESIEKFLPQVRANLALELKSTTAILKEQPALETLQSQEEIWKQRHLQLTQWLNVLTDRATKLQVALTQLKKLDEIWSRTRDAEESANARDPILQQINRTLAAIQAAQQPDRTQRDQLFKLQSNVAEALAQVPYGPGRGLK